MRRLAIFDFDGTLVDTITDVALCFNESLKQSGFPEHPLDAFDRFVGGNLETVVSRMLPPEHCTTKNIEQVKTLYRKLYLSSDKPNTAPYPGILSLLCELKDRDFKLAVNSNKGQQLLDDMILKIFPPGFFDAVIGYLETRPSKPDPYGVDEICRICGCTRQDAVYIGDGESDVLTAVQAGIPCIFVTWGQGSAELIHAPETLTLAENVEQLGQLLTVGYMM